MICPKCGGEMNERNVDFVTSYNDTLKSLDSFYKKFLFFLMFPYLPYSVRTNPIISLTNPINLKTFLCSKCGFIENNLIPVSSKFMVGINKYKIYYEILAVIAIIGLVFMIIGILK